MQHSDSQYGKERYFCIIPAAGIGRRFGNQLPKQYQLIHGKTILEHTISKFVYHPKIEKIVVVIHPNDYFWPRLRLETYFDKIITTAGGLERCHSVFNGLQALSSYTQPQDWILVHDAVRPCIRISDIDKLIGQIDQHPVGGILGMKISDTLKRSNDHNQIIDTVSRENIWQALTPQMFREQILFQAIENVIHTKNFVTDEAAAIETLGFIPLIIEGHRDNIKITHAEDLPLAEKYLL